MAIIINIYIMSRLPDIYRVSEKILIQNFDIYVYKLLLRSSLMSMSQITANNNIQIMIWNSSTLE